MIWEALFTQVLTDTFQALVERDPFDLEVTLTTINENGQACQVSEVPVGATDADLEYCILEFAPGYACTILSADLTPPGDPALGWRGPVPNYVPNWAEDATVRLWSGPLPGTHVYFGGGAPADKSIVFANLDNRDTSSGMGDNSATNYGSKTEHMDDLCVIQMSHSLAQDGQLVNYSRAKREFLYMVDQTKWAIRRALPESCRNVKVVASPKSYYPAKGKRFFRADLRLEWSHRI